MEALVKDDDWLDAGMRVDFSGTVLSHLIRRKSYLIAINIVMSSLQGLLRSTARIHPSVTLTDQGTILCSTALFSAEL